MHVLERWAWAASKRTRFAASLHFSNKDSAYRELCEILTALCMWKPSHSMSLKFGVPGDHWQALHPCATDCDL